MISIDQETVTTLAEVLSTARVIWHQQSRQTTAVRPYTRKPMVHKGPRQVGKTWLMKGFGKQPYKNFVYLNFEEEDALKSIFESNKNPQRIIELPALIAGQRIQPEDTLIIFDDFPDAGAALRAMSPALVTSISWLLYRKSQTTIPNSSCPRMRIRRRIFFSDRLW